MSPAPSPLTPSPSQAPCPCTPLPPDPWTPLPPDFPPAEDKEDKDESATLRQGTSHCSCLEHCFLFSPLGGCGPTPFCTSQVFSLEENTVNLQQISHQTTEIGCIMILAVRVSSHGGRPQRSSESPASPLSVPSPHPKRTSSVSLTTEVQQPLNFDVISAPITWLFHLPSCTTRKIDLWKPKKKHVTYVRCVLPPVTRSLHINGPIPSATY